MSIYPAVDSNTLTYLRDAIAVDDYEPTLDPSELAGERVAMARCFFYGNCSPWVPPTSLDVPESAVQRRAEELLLHHNTVNDCRVVAETEFARLQTLLTVDRDMRRRLQPHTAVKILLPSECRQPSLRRQVSR